MLFRLVLLLMAALMSQSTSGTDDRLILPASLNSLLSNRCIECHSSESSEADVQLDKVNQLDLSDQIDLLNRVQEQLFLKRMPPEESEPLSATEQAQLSGWIAAELDKRNASKLKEKIRKPEFGNYVDHESLFSGEYQHLPGFTYDRRWLISEFIFNAKFQRILLGNARVKRNGKNVPVNGSHRFRNFSLTNPFLLPNRSGVRYYADTDLSGGHLSSMLTNAQKTSEYMTDFLVKRQSSYLPVINQIMAMENQHEATLAARREFLESFIAQLCDEFYGQQNRTLLPTFTPVQLNDAGKLNAGESYKKAPFHVALNMLKKLNGDMTVFQYLMDEDVRSKSDSEFRELCERTWFYFGDHERDIQGRVTILRDYLPEMRDHLDKNRKKFKAKVYKPLSEREMGIIESSIRKHRLAGETYSQLIEKCLSDWEQKFLQERLEAGAPNDLLLRELVEQLGQKILERSLPESEVGEYVGLARSYVKKLGNLKAIQKLIQTFILSTEFVYRQEFGQGNPDPHGRRMLSPRDASYAIAYALTDQSPDEELVEAVENNRLKTRADYRREVERILNKRDVYFLIDPILEDNNYPDNSTNTAIRKLRFFREFFGYPQAITVFKDEKRFGGDRLGNATSRLLNETDRFVEFVLERDERVFEELLTTDRFFVYHDGDNERMQSASDRIKRIYHHFKDLDWENFKKEDLLDHRDFLKEVKMRSVDPDKLEARNRQGTTIQLFKKSMRTITARLNKGQKEAAPYDLYRGYGNDFMRGYNVAKFFNISLDNWDYQTRQPAPVANRKGILTHPAWLIAHSQNTESDPIIRGKWIREKLLAGQIPDVPITVDASVPENHHRTLRDRLASVTEDTYCWKCHRQMNPLGYAFECYDDFGRFRKEEALEYPEHLIEKGVEQRGNHLIDTRDRFKALPVNSKGYLEGTGESALDGVVNDAMDLSARLAKSRRVRQSIIRYAFRYFLGRNERLSDSGTLMDAEKAYLKSNGSFDAVIISLLTSDSFIYRKAVEE